MKKEKCYICEKGNMVKKKVDFSMYEISLGKFEAQVCNRCGEEFFDEKTSDLIDEAAKEKGLWGLDAKTKVTKSGSSMAVTIQKKIADFMQFRRGKEVYIHPESKKRLIIEVS